MTVQNVAASNVAAQEKMETKNVHEEFLKRAHQIHSRKNAQLTKFQDSKCESG